MTQRCATFLGWHGRSGSAPLRNFSNAAAGIGFQTIFSAEDVTIFGAGEDWWPSRQHASSGPGRFSLVVGEPIARTTDLLTRSDWIDAIDSGKEALASGLRSTHGTFCGLSYSDGQLALFTDRLGVRGVYWHCFGGDLIFSSSLGMLAECLKSCGISLPRNHDAISELVAFGIPLADRTEYSGISRLRESQYLEHEQGLEPAVRAYSSWPTTPAPPCSIEDAALRIDAAFQLAIRDRLKASSPAGQPHCLLSGGMDSRYVLAHLMQCATMTPVTLNVAPEGSTDCILGNHAAEKMGSIHFHLPTLTDLGTGLPAGIQRVQTSQASGDAHLWWSGDGGSVGLGHVYLDNQTTIEAPDDDGVIAERLAQKNKWGLNARIFSRQWKHLRQRPLQGLRAELQRVRQFPSDRRAFAFLLFNDQQRHMHHHFDNAHTRSYDLVLPFFDPRVLLAVLATPIELMLSHKIYNYIFENLLPTSIQTAWQTYPGHQPCPYPAINSAGRNQWADSWNDPKFIQRAWRTRALELLKLTVKGDMPSQLSRVTTLTATLPLLAGNTSRTYLVEQITKVVDSYRDC